MSYFGKFLIIENDSKILDVIFHDKNLIDRYPSLTARSVGEAISILQRTGKEFRMIFLSERVARLSDMTDFWKETEGLKDLPIVLLEDKNADSALRGLISSRIPLPQSYMELVKYVMGQVNEVHDWRKTQNDGIEKEKEIQLQEEKYIGSSIRDFIMTPKSFFNIYIRLSPGKFIKIMNAGDDISQQEFDRYRSKGIDEFFVPIEEHEKFVHLQANMSSKIIQSDAATGFKVKSMLKLGANVTSNLFKCGITSDRMDNAHMFLDQTVMVLRHLKIKNEVMASFLKNIDQNEHGAAVAFISGILANHLGFESSKSIKVVGTTALLHDIGLYDLDPDFEEGEEHTDEKKKEIFSKHASHGAEILRSTGLFEEVICHAVENHHRRRKGENSIRRSSSVNLITEIVSVSDEFFNSVIRNGYSPQKVSFFMENELKNYSPNVERAFHVLTKGKKAA